MNSLKALLESKLNNIKAQKPKMLFEMGQFAVHDFKDNFEEEGFNGKPWKEVQRRIEGTIWNQKASSYQKTAPILTDTGNLKNSIAVRKKNVNSVVIYPNAKAQTYAYKHQFGEKSERIPQRKFMGTTKYLKEGLNKIVIRHLKKAL